MYQFPAPIAIGFILFGTILALLSLFFVVTVRWSMNPQSRLHVEANRAVYVLGGGRHGLVPQFARGYVMAKAIIMAIVAVLLIALPFR